jgi:predicted RNA-binding Zn ribbon-like protein
MMVRLAKERSVLTERSPIPVFITERGRLSLLGGHPALDFTNTVDWRGRAEPYEFLTDYDMVLRWAGRIGLLGTAEEAALLRRAAATPDEHAQLLETVLSLREAFYRLLVAQTRGISARPEDLATLNDALDRFPPPGEIVALGASYAWKSAPAETALARPIALLARIAAEFLVSPDLHRLRLCEGSDCGWLFLDLSPNRRRRWCSMEGCGNRAKARRHYQRRRDDIA